MHRFCACGEIGRRARLRIWCSDTCRFESYQAHSALQYVQLKARITSCQLRQSVMRVFFLSSQDCQHSCQPNWANEIKSTAPQSSAFVILSLGEGRPYLTISLLADTCLSLFTITRYTPAESCPRRSMAMRPSSSKLL